MRWTEPNRDVRDVPAGELWVGIIRMPRPHVAVSTRAKDDGTLVVSRFHPNVAREIGEKLIRSAERLNADNN